MEKTEAEVAKKEWYRQYYQANKERLKQQRRERYVKEREGIEPKKRGRKGGPLGPYKDKWFAAGIAAASVPPP